MKKVIIFDFFGVICSEVAPFWFASYFSNSEAKRIKREVVGLADIGEISQEELFLKLSKMVNVSPEIVLEEWISYVDIDLDMVEYLEGLKSKYRIALLTNAPSPFVRKILKDHNLNSYFEKIIVSSEEGMAKPDPSIYKKMLDELSVAPEMSLFIDDNPENLVGAESSGIKGVLYTNVKALKNKMSDFGIDPA
jgi:HAD superfamily hydrolase (TIGR01509 family)